MSIIAGIAATKATLDVAKILTDLVKRPTIDAADVQAKLHELLMHAVNAQTELGEAQLEMFELRRQLEDRDASKALEADMEFSQDGGIYLRRSEKAKGVSNPHCPVCWGDNRKAVPLQQMPVQGSYRCIKHNAVFHTQAARDEQRKTEERRRADANAVAIIRGPHSWMS